MRVATLACCSVALLGLLGTAAGWSAGDGWPGSLSTTFNRPLPPSMASWQMNRSTLCFFVGNETSSDSPAELRSEARFGTVGIGWQLANVQQNFSRVEAAELAAAKAIKELRSDALVMVTRNTDCAGGIYDSVKAALTTHPEYFLLDDRGHPYQMPWVANDPAWQRHSEYFFFAEYFNFSNPAAADWWVNTFVGGAVRESIFDGATRVVID
jgi:hypothetical protein